MEEFEGVMRTQKGLTEESYPEGVTLDLNLEDKEFGEGDGTWLQYSCLENPVDGGAWWAAVHGVAKSRT